MKVQSINTNYPSSTTFGSFRRANTISQKMFSSISQYPAVKAFGKKYNAEIGMRAFFSKKDTKRQQLALVLEDIEPNTILGKIKHIFTKKPNESIVLKTNTTNEDDFMNYIANQHSDSLFEIYNKF